MKVKALREWCEKHNDWEVVEFYDFDGSGYNKFIGNYVRLDTCNPRRCEFKHIDCKYCEEITIKGNKRLYCNKKDDVLPIGDKGSCDYDFEHKKYDIVFRDRWF